jgi:1-deoxy-D-xylulose-5-phosphate reductoisomerase
MKKKIAILGSTGSIGKTLLKIVEKNKDNFEIVLLSANKNYQSLFKQAKKFKVKNLIITDKKTLKNIKKKEISQSIRIYDSFNSINKIFKKKIDYVMSSIVGIDGLEPTLKIIKFTKKIAIANKESIICGWDLIKKELKKNNTKFIPVDSEHFSIWYALKNENSKNIEKLYITASGGPFYKIPIKSFKNIKVKNALKHPNWKMGKKISVDSATIINKVYEIIEAKNIFNLSYKKIKVLIHPNSYVHCLIKFKSGLIKIIAHETTMKIPILNTIYSNKHNKLIKSKIDIKSLNNLSLGEVSRLRYPMIKLINLLPEKNSLFETIIVSANDTLVDLFLKKKIKFTNIQKELFNFIQSKEFGKYKKIFPKKVQDIIKLNHYVRLKLLKKVYKFDDV